MFDNAIKKIQLKYKLKKLKKTLARTNNPMLKALGNVMIDGLMASDLYKDIVKPKVKVSQETIDEVRSVRENQEYKVINSGVPCRCNCHGKEGFTRKLNDGTVNETNELWRNVHYHLERVKASDEGVVIVCSENEWDKTTFETMVAIRNINDSKFKNLIMNLEKIYEDNVNKHRSL
jgi:hypothetical protein